MASFTLKTEFRKQAYYNKYKYRISLQQPGLYAIKRATSPQHLAELIEVGQRTAKKHSAIFGFTRLPNTYWDSINYKELKRIWGWVDEHRNECKFRFERDIMGIFTNDLELLKQIEEICPPPLFPTRFYQAKWAAEGGTILFAKEPQFKFRMYFKSGVSSYEFLDLLRDYLIQNENNKDIGFSRTLAIGVRGGQFNPNGLHWFHGGYFVDFNKESTLTMLHMLFSNFVGKTYKLAKRPEE